MKILFITSLYPATGDPEAMGLTRALHNLVKHWRQYPGADIRVVCPVYYYIREIITGRSRDPAKKSFRVRTFTLEDVPVLVYPIFKIPRLLYFYRPLYRFLDRYLAREEFEPDVIVAHYDKSLNIGLHYSRRRNLPLVAGFHITPDLMTNNPGPFTRRCGNVLAHASVVACRSLYIRNKIIQWFPAYKEKCFIAYSGIEDSIIARPTAGVYRLQQWKSGDEKKKLSILTVGALIERKNHHISLKALAHLKDSADWTYTVIGDGEERPKLEMMVKQLGLSGRVEFKGILPRREVLKEMSRSHIFLLVSHMETFGLVYLEAMATGNIVIGAEAEGIDGIIVNGQNGFLSPAGDVESLTLLLENIMLNVTEPELEKMLLQANETLQLYTEEGAAMNYWQKLKDVGDRP